MGKTSDNLQKMLLFSGFFSLVVGSFVGIADCILLFPVYGSDCSPVARSMLRCLEGECVNSPRISVTDQEFRNITIEEDKPNVTTNKDMTDIPWARADGVETEISSRSLEFAFDSSADYESAIHLTSREGNIRFLAQSRNPYFALTKARLRQASILSQIRNRARKLVDEAIGHAYHGGAKFTARSFKNTQSNEKIINDIRSYEVPGFGLRKSDVTHLVATFVANQINEYVREVRISLRNIDSRVPVRNATLRFRSRPSPAPADLVDQYFTGDLKEYGVGIVQSYDRGHGERTFNNAGDLFLTLYTKHPYRVEIVHPQYHYFEGIVLFEHGVKEKEILMAELGTKMRVRIVDQ